MVSRNSLHTRLPVILMKGYLSVRAGNTILEGTVAEVITKPIALPELLKTIKRILKSCPAFKNHFSLLTRRDREGAFQVHLTAHGTPFDCAGKPVEFNHSSAIVGNVHLIAK